MSEIDMSDDFHDRLLRFSQEIEQTDRDDIEKHLWHEYGQTIVPLVVDMSGFTRLSRAYGIVHYLSMVRRMQLIATPIVQSHHGKIVKYEADNAFAFFTDPGDAIRASIALNLAMDSANLLTQEDLDIYISCGIDYGKCLVPYEHDFFGNPVNIASKLGEDLGEPGQILVTEQAMERVHDACNIESEVINFTIGGGEMSVHSILYRHDEEQTP